MRKKIEKSTSPPESIDSCRANIFLDVLKSIESGVLIVDPVGQQLIFFNEYARCLLNEAGCTIEYQALFDLFLRTLEGVRGPEFRKSGKMRVQVGERILGYSAYRFSAENSLVAIFVQDITDQERLDSIAEAVQLSNNIGFIFSGIRHEIGNPLNSIKMALLVLQKNIDNFKHDDLERYFNRMGEDVAKMESLLKAFKNYNMFERPVATQVDLAELFELFLALSRSEVQSQGVTVTLALDPEARFAILDPRAFQQVVLNLVSNALDALQGREDGWIRIASKASGGNVLVYVSDNGCGMSEAQQQVLFKPFHTNKAKGTGLGLVIVKKMLAQMGCGIEIESENGKGTTVSLLLPAAREESPEMRSHVQ